jgi:HTH-type transcriptional repressor of NAD biosynthesis genes
MVRGFVFGKFMPFHAGHEAMIRFALEKCDLVKILICCSDKERVPCSKRKQWIQSSFDNNSKVEIIEFNYLEKDLPNTSVSSVEVSKQWSEVFLRIVPDCSCVITSELYGDYIAEFMRIKHIAFDRNRIQYPISSTAFRKSRFNNWNFIPDAVKRDYAIKVVILGTESTGKSRLSESLAKYFNCSLVSETGRELIKNSQSFEFEHLNQVAREHALRIETTLTGPSPLVIIDTDIHTTISYGQYAFNRLINTEQTYFDLNRAHLYLYLINDVPHVQDGTRLSEFDRNFLDINHRKVLAEYDVPFVEIGGTWENRFNAAVIEIDRLISEFH